MSGMMWLRTAFFAAAGLGVVITRLWPSDSHETIKGRGKVANIDPAARSLAVKLDVPVDKLETFQWDSSSQFFNIDGSISPEEIRVGQRVSIILNEKTVSRLEVEPVYEPGQSEAG